MDLNTFQKDVVEEWIVFGLIALFVLIYRLSVKDEIDIEKVELNSAQLKREQWVRTAWISILGLHIFIGMYVNLFKLMNFVNVDFDHEKIFYLPIINGMPGFVIYFYFSYLRRGVKLLFFSLSIIPIILLILLALIIPNPDFYNEAVDIFNSRFPNYMYLSIVIYLAHYCSSYMLYNVNRVRQKKKNMMLVENRAK